MQARPRVFANGAGRVRAALRSNALVSPQGNDRHTVFGQSAGLVGAQHRGCAQRLDRGRAAREHAGREMRHAPIAMKTVMTSGNSSGSKDMPRAMPPSVASSQEPRSSPYSSTARQPAIAPTTANTRTIASASAAAVAPFRCYAKRRPILPISLRTPVACTRATPAPRTTSVPANRYGRSSPPGRGRSGGDCRSRSAHRDFPHRHRLAREQRLVQQQIGPGTSVASAVTRSPSATTMRSSRTTSRPAITTRRPSRITVARGLARSAGLRVPARCEIPARW